MPDVAHRVAQHVANRSMGSSWFSPVNPSNPWQHAGSAFPKNLNTNMLDKILPLVSELRKHLQTHCEAVIPCSMNNDAKLYFGILGTNEIVPIHFLRGSGLVPFAVSTYDLEWLEPSERVGVVNLASKMINHHADYEKLVAKMTFGFNDPIVVTEDSDNRYFIDGPRSASQLFYSEIFPRLVGKTKGTKEGEGIEVVVDIQAVVSDGYLTQIIHMVYDRFPYALLKFTGYCTEQVSELYNPFNTPLV